MDSQLIESVEEYIRLKITCKLVFIIIIISKMFGETYLNQNNSNSLFVKPG